MRNPALDPNPPPAGLSPSNPLSSIFRATYDFGISYPPSTQIFDHQSYLAGITDLLISHTPDILSTEDSLQFLSLALHHQLSESATPNHYTQHLKKALTQPIESFLHSCGSKKIHTYNYTENMLRNPIKARKNGLEGGGPVGDQHINLELMLMKVKEKMGNCVKEVNE
jgi:hypothetical protein